MRLRKTRNISIRAELFRLLLPIFLVSCHQAFASSPESATITFTAHGIPHIRAHSFYGLGYGYAYAAASIDLCNLADVFLDARGERAAYLGDNASSMSPFGGGEVKSVVSDLATQLLISDKVLAFQRAGLSEDARSLIDGYAAGFTQYLADVPREKRPQACRDAGWVKPISSNDILRRVASALLLTGFFDQELFDAAPPSAVPLSLNHIGPSGNGAAAETILAYPKNNVDVGSNAYAFGSLRTANRRGLLLGNPHWFWTGTSRFMEAHLMLPGKYDVMGVSVEGMPLITLGFNKTLTWTHTVASDARGTIYELTLDPEDPTHYMIDGHSIAMQKRSVTVSVANSDGTTRQVSHTFWMTEYGPVIESKNLPWSRSKAYALADANTANNRYLNQLLQMGEAKDVHELKAALEKTMGLVWVNTLAADSHGEALYADFTVVPYVTREMIRTCGKSISFPQAKFVNVMDGSRSECQWHNDPLAPERGMLPAAQKPSLVTKDYVENSNSSYWLVNPNHPLEGFSLIIGDERMAPNLRTLQGHQQVRDRQFNRDGLGGTRFDLKRLEDVLFSNRDYLAELTLDDLLDECSKTPTVTLPEGKSVDLTKACDTLRMWDRKDNLNSVGAQIFREFAREEKPRGEEDPARSDSFWKTPFDPTRPADTPRGLDTSTQKPLLSLARAVVRLEKAGISLDSELGNIQFIERAGVKIPLHGGLIFNRISLTLTPGVGYTEPIGSADSYIQAVTFDKSGPVADMLLLNSQSSNPSSPWYADQAMLYSQKRWLRAPFRDADISRHAIAHPRKLAIPNSRQVGYAAQRRAYFSTLRKTPPLEQHSAQR